MWFSGNQVPRSHSVRLTLPFGRGRSGFEISSVDTKIFITLQVLSRNRANFCKHYTSIIFFSMHPAPAVQSVDSGPNRSIRYPLVILSQGQKLTEDIEGSQPG